MEDLNTQMKSSALYSDDLAPIPVSARTWSLLDMTAIWIGMAVCIPTYLLASYMMKSGLSWIEALVIIALGNLIITIPMVLNGHAGVKYGVPFPVIGRASFGTKGIHIAAVVRGIVACGWFGIQTWIGGLAFYAIWHALRGSEPSLGLDFEKFISFGLFWLLNVYFIWKGTESIKWLEKFAAPILIGIGLALIIWGARTTGSFTKVLAQSNQLARPAAVLIADEGEALKLALFPTKSKENRIKANAFKVFLESDIMSFTSEWKTVSSYGQTEALQSIFSKIDISSDLDSSPKVQVQFRASGIDGQFIESSLVPANLRVVPNFWSKIWSYLLWLTAMVGFWATMAISIADITRYTATQRNQVLGQFLGLPGTMALFSFVGIFVTCAAIINFPDILVADDAPWDPVSLIGRFDNPLVVIIAQIFMIIATLSTNIAANVIAPANAFSNLNPTKLSFRTGGLITAVIGIIICPWWLLDEISNLLLFVSSFLGPVLGIIICDYFLIRHKTMDLNALFDEKGIYSYGGSGFNKSALIALGLGILVALIGLWVPSLSFLYTLSWFSGFFVSFGAYFFMMRQSS
jgi:cytosine/uracil/thiamine/allantoin permease